MSVTVVSVYFIIDSVWKLLDMPLHDITHSKTIFPLIMLNTIWKHI